MFVASLQSVGISHAARVLGQSAKQQGSLTFWEIVLKLINLFQTDLMPDTRNTFEPVQFISTEIETYVRNYSLPSGISQLVWLQWIVILPVFDEFQQELLIFNSHTTANRKLGY